MRYLQENAAGIHLIEAACGTASAVRAVVDGQPVRRAGAHAHRGEAPIAPQSPYGESKWMIERRLRWAGRRMACAMRCLRYFNAAGADPAGRLGEDHTPETHLIPLVIDAALGRRERLTVFGTDYPTADGTCIRDYIHVTDLADAHLLALGQLGTRSVTYNLGNGRAIPCGTSSRR